MRAINEPSIYILIFYKKYYIIYIENKKGIDKYDL